MKAKLLRQGDVLLVAVRSLAHGAVQTVREDGQIILAFGEVTGHAHRLAEPAKAKLWSAQAERFLQVMETVALAHEEHTAVPIPPGIYRVVIQQEYHPAALRNVAD